MKSSRGARFRVRLERAIGETLSERPPKIEAPRAGEEALLEITDVTTEGEGIARWPGGLVVFVPGTLPGDRVRARFAGVQGRIGRARSLEQVEAASGRREVPCAYQERCGGCALMPLEEEEVLEVKARQVVETLRRVGAAGWEAHRPPISPCADPSVTTAGSSSCTAPRGAGRTRRHWPRTSWSGRAASRASFASSRRASVASRPTCSLGEAS